MFLDNLSYNMCFCTMLYLGILIGVLYEITVFISKIVKSNIVFRQIFDGIVVFVAGLVFIVAINMLGNGQFRLFFVIGYLLGFWLERTSIGFLVAKICEFVYNKGIKVLKAIRRKKPCHKKS